MTLFNFTLTVEGADILTDEAQNALFDAGCNDATFSASSGVQRGEFDRKAEEFAEAVATAIKAVESAVPGARVVEMRRDDAPAASN